jgi:hypothetical protein
MSVESVTYKSALLESSSVSARRSEARPYGSCDGGSDNGRNYHLFIAVAVQETQRTATTTGWGKRSSVSLTASRLGSSKECTVRSIQIQ